MGKYTESHKKRLSGAIRAKNGLFKSLVVAFLFVIGITAPGFSEASTWERFWHFQDCNAGDLISDNQVGTSCEDWIQSGQQSNPAIIKIQGENRFAGYSQSAVGGSLTLLPSAIDNMPENYISFEWRITSLSTGVYPKFVFNMIGSPPYGESFSITVDAGNGLKAFAGSWNENLLATLTESNLNIWYRTFIELDPVQDKFRVFTTGLHDWSSWIDTQYPISNTERLQIVLHETGEIDNILLGELSMPIVPEFQGVININPTFPPDGQITVIEDNEFTATGSWSVSSLSGFDFYEMGIRLENLETGFFTIKGESITGTPGSSDNYSIFIDDLDNQNFRVCYWAQGVTERGIHMIEYFCDPNSIIRVGQYPDLPIDIEIETGYPDNHFEDCSEMPLLEKMVCEIKNFAYSMIYPKPEDAIKLRRNFEQVKTRFPMSYIQVFRKSLSETRSGLSERALTISLFGNEGKIDFQGLNTEYYEFEGKSFDLAGLIKRITTAVLIIIFIIYALNYARRIF